MLLENRGLATASKPPSSCARVANVSTPQSWPTAAAPPARFGKHLIVIDAYQRSALRWISQVAISPIVRARPRTFIAPIPERRRMPCLCRQPTLSRDTVPLPDVNLKPSPCDL